MHAIKNTKQDDKSWPEHVSQWRDSALTQIAYCRQYNLCPHQFSYHKRKYLTGVVPAKDKSSGFVRVQVVPQPQYHEPLTLHFANGARLTGISANNIAVVKQLAEVLS